MTEFGSERRRFTRVEMALPVHVHQGARIWHQQLIDISLCGVSTDQPEEWDARHDEPFTLVIDIDESSTVALPAKMEYARAGRLGFSLRQAGPENIESLRAVMQAHLDIFELEEELSRLN